MIWKLNKLLWCVAVGVWFSYLAVHSLDHVREKSDPTKFTSARVASYDSGRTRPHVPRANVKDGPLLTREQATTLLDLYPTSDTDPVLLVGADGRRL